MINESHSKNLHELQSYISQHKLTLIMIIAQTMDGSIGTGDKIPWHISADLKFFKETTMGHNLIMGANTYKSIGRPLPGRKNIVISNSLQSDDKIFLAKNALQALQLCDAKNLVFIAGGSQIYKLFEDLVTEAYITLVDVAIKNASIQYNALEFVHQNNWRLQKEQKISDQATLYKYVNSLKGT